jgi:two-component system, LuxR family, response regulator FixJ
MKKPSILIVDDEESIRVSLESILKKKFYVKTVENGSIALEMLQNDRYDIILTDIMMNDMSGIELLKETKKYFSEIPVLLMTGHSSLDTAIEALRLGASDYLIKPCTKKFLLLSIARCLEMNTTGKNNEELTRYFETRINILQGKKPFTKRELEIFNHLISGMPDKSIADELAVTLPTIKFHLQNIYKKTGINGRKGVLKMISSFIGGIVLSKN